MLSTFFCVNSALVRHVIQPEKMNKERGKKASTDLRSFAVFLCFKMKAHSYYKTKPKRYSSATDLNV